VRVIDSSSLAKYVNREAGWEKVQDVLEEGCISLELSLKEVGNSLWKRLRAGELGEKLASLEFLSFVRNRPYKLAEQEELYEGAFRVAIRTGGTMYDSLYIELARKTGLTLVTSDVEQANAAKSLGVEALLIT